LSLFLMILASHKKSNFSPDRSSPHRYWSGTLQGPDWTYAILQLLAFWPIWVHSKQSVRCPLCRGGHRHREFTKKNEANRSARRSIPAVTHAHDASFYFLHPVVL
jgi:hypothetical protein